MTRTDDSCPPSPCSLLLGVRRLSWGMAIACSLVACGGSTEPAAASSSVAAHQAVTFSHPALEEHLAGRVRRGILAIPRTMPSADALFDWAARTYPQFFPGHRTNQTAAPYIYRYYPETGNYVGLDGETVAVLGPISGHQIMTVGTRADFACEVSPISCNPGANVGRIAVGHGFSLAVRADGSVLQWGGHGNTEAGTWVPGTTAIKLDNLNGIVGVTTGHDASIALNASGAVHSWGANFYGALGHPTQNFSETLPQPVPSPLMGKVQDVVIDGGAFEMMTIFVRSDGTVGYTPKTRGTGPVAVGSVTGLSNVVSLSSGGGADYMVTRGYAVRADGSVWALNWKEVFVGNGWQYQLVAEQVPRAVGIAQLSCTYRYCLAASKDGSVWAWGDGSGGALGDGTGWTRDLPVKALGLLNVQKVAAGNGQSYAITKDGALYAWGALGGGAVSQDYYRAHEEDFKRPQLLIESRFGVADIATSGTHTILLLKDGSVWGWGDNSAGQVGDGTKDTYDGRISRVMGISLN